MRRRNFLATTGAAGFLLPGCMENLGEAAGSTPTEQNIPPVVVISSPLNEDIETYHVQVNGQPNSADYVEFEHKGELVYTMREEIDEPVTIVEKAEKGERTRAIAVEGETKEIIEERKVA